MHVPGQLMVHEGFVDMPVVAPDVRPADEAVLSPPDHFSQRTLAAPVTLNVKAKAGNG